MTIKGENTMAKRTIKSLGVLSVAKIYGVVCTILGLIFGLIYGAIFMLVGGAMMAGGQQTSEAAMGGAGAVGIGLVMIVAFPIFYGVFGFVCGALTAWIYNVAVGLVGGLEFEVEDTEPSYQQPYTSSPRPFNADTYQEPPPSPRAY